MKRQRNQVVKNSNRKLDTVGVAGSIPVEPTILKQPFALQVYEIPTDCRIVPSIEWSGGLPRFSAIVVLNPPKRREKSVKSTERRKLVRGAL